MIALDPSRRIPVTLGNATYQVKALTARQYLDLREKPIPPGAKDADVIRIWAEDLAAMVASSEQMTDTTPETFVALHSPSELADLWQACLRAQQPGGDDAKKSVSPSESAAA